MYRYIRSQIHKRGFRLEHERLAIEAGYQAAKDIDNNPYVFANFADTISSLCYGYNIGVIDIDGLPSDRDSLLEVANEYASKAVTLAPKDPSTYSILSKVLALQERFEEAEKNLNEAIKWELETEDNPSTSDYKMQMSGLQQERRHVEFTEEAISRTQEEIEELGGELDSIVDRHRSQTLQFLGFFAAIVAIVVTSAQVAVTVPSFADASRLILTLIGGILVAFGGLSIAIPQASSSVPWWRTAMIMIAGLILIILDFVLG